jgi:hypothetical protein
VTVEILSMIVIVANRWDRALRDCVSRWAADDIGVLTARDLSAAGWRQRLSAEERGTAVIERKRVPQAEITGVVTLVPCVFENELVEIAPKDRPYIASEMNAFLLYWLSSLRCPVLNPPTPTCLSGPCWPREKWVTVAAHAEIPVESFRRRSAFGSAAEEEAVPAVSVVTVAGKSVIGDTAPELRIQARQLAELAGVELLAVHFSSPEPDARFVTAGLVPGLTDDRVADAVLAYLRAGTANCE